MEGVRRVMLTSSFWPGWLKERSDLISDFLPGRWLQRADIYGHCNCLALSHNNEGIFHAHADQGGRHFLLQGIFSTQGLHLSLLYCRRILYHILGTLDVTSKVP